jgi:hypothetical protein
MEKVVELGRVSRSFRRGDGEVWALLAKAELDDSATTGVIYWEGPFTASGTQRGQGYVEMTGYAGTLEGRF